MNSQPNVREVTSLPTASELRGPAPSQQKVLGESHPRPPRVGLAGAQQFLQSHVVRTGMAEGGGATPQISGKLLGGGEEEGGWFSPGNAQTGVSK